VPPDALTTAELWPEEGVKGSSDAETMVLEGVRITPLIALPLVPEEEGVRTAPWSSPDPGVGVVAVAVAAVRISPVGVVAPLVASRRVASRSKPWTATSGLLMILSVSLRSTSMFSLARFMPDGQLPLSR
jgi:hypothetical protein